MDGLAATAAAGQVAAAAGVRGASQRTPSRYFLHAEANLKLHSQRPTRRRAPGSSSMKVRLLLGLQLLLLGALSVGGVTIAPLRRSMALGVLRKLVDLEKVGAR